MTTYNLTDTTTGSTYEDLDIVDLEEKLNTLFDRSQFAYENPEGVDHTIGEVIDQLILKTAGHEYTGEEEATLSVTIE